MKAQFKSVPTVETVTPELAERWLSLNTHNRTLRDGVVSRYAESIKAGQWELNGETIKNQCVTRWTTSIMGSC